MSTDKQVPLTMSAGRLGDCPFCGKIADLQHHGGIFSVGQRDGYRVECANCAAKTCYWHTADQAKEAWNQRTDTAAHAAGSAPQNDSFSGEGQ